MSKRTYTIFIALGGVVCVYVVVRSFLFADVLTLRNALVQGFLVGFGLAVVTVEILARIKAAKVNGWVTVFGCGVPGNGMFTRAHMPQYFPAR
jgi:hypothetical protein